MFDKILKSVKKTITTAFKTISYELGLDTAARRYKRAVTKQDKLAVAIVTIGNVGLAVVSASAIVSTVFLVGINAPVPTFVAGLLLMSYCVADWYVTKTVDRVPLSVAS